MSHQEDVFDGFSEEVVAHYLSLLDRFDFLLIDIKIIPLTEFKLDTFQGMQNLNTLREALIVLKIIGKIHNYKIDVNSSGSYLCVQYKSPPVLTRA
tara:strand:+ start:408 stop:695 length:288 start_codon:yes stop_codon:yes gene_type:complete